MVPVHNFRRPEPAPGTAATPRAHYDEINSRPYTNVVSHARYARLTAPLNQETMINEVQLAWVLATVADPYLSTAERHDVYIEIAVGDMFPVICRLTAIVAREDLVLPEGVVAELDRWLDAYVGHDQEPRQRALIAKVKTYPPR